MDQKTLFWFELKRIGVHGRPLLLILIPTSWFSWLSPFNCKLGWLFIGSKFGEVRNRVVTWSWQLLFFVSVQLVGEWANRSLWLTCRQLRRASCLSECARKGVMSGRGIVPSCFWLRKTLDGPESAFRADFLSCKARFDVVIYVTYSLVNWINLPVVETLPFWNWPSRLRFRTIRAWACYAGVVYCD